jgi:type IV pilus assembly protein PilQ
LREFALRFVQPGAGLTTPVELDDLEGGRGVILRFVQKNPNVRYANFDQRETDDEKWAKAKASSKQSKATPDGALYLHAETEPYARVRVTRAEMDKDGIVIKPMSEATILEALDVLLRANDLRMEEAGNFIYVYTRVEWEEILRGRTKRESRNFPLEYLNAKDASEFIKPILSETGKVSFVGDVDKGFQPSEEDGGRDSWAFQGMIVVSDFPDNLKAIEALLKEIDSPPAQVVVESTVVSSKVQQDDGFGVDVSVIGSLDFNNLTNPMSGANDLFAGVNEGIQPADNRGYSGNSAVAGWDRASTMRVGVLAQDVAVFLRLLDSVTDTTVLARPRVMALNRQRAQILIGRRVGYLTSTTTQTSTTQTVEFLDSGIKLIFRPFISTDGSIRMELAPSVSDAKIETLTSADGATQSVPNEDTSEIVTNVRVKDGQTLVLGGLFKEDTKIERRQVPGLGDIPLLGNAFKGYDDQLKREEIEQGEQGGEPCGQQGVAKGAQHRSGV